MSDCQHVTVTWEPFVMQFPDRIETAHDFTCDWCPARASFVTVDIRLDA